MNKYLLICIAFILSLANLLAIDKSNMLIVEKPEYQISITHGGEFKGDIKIQLFPEIAPEHCRNFDSLVSIGFYNGTAFHRVIPNFMIQGGDPNSKDKDKSTWGYGDPSQRKIPAEFSSLKHLRGTISAARAQDPNSATSQFFICVVPCSWLDGLYSIYGEVTEGMDIVDYVVNVPKDAKDNPLEKIEMTVTKLEASEVNDYNQNNSQILIYPNPANEYIEILNLNNEHEVFYIYNCFGQQVQKIEPNNKRVDIEQLPAGIYFIKSENNVQSFIVVR